MNIILKAARTICSIGSFGVHIVFPAFGIPRPWNYFAGAFWVYWVCVIAYNIANR